MICAIKLRVIVSRVPRYNTIVHIVTSQRIAPEFVAAAVVAVDCVYTHFDDLCGEVVFSRLRLVRFGFVLFVVGSWWFLVVLLLLFEIVVVVDVFVKRRIWGLLY